MGSECNNPSKRHYDITLSKRTRKPSLNVQEAAAAAANNHLKNPNINTTKARSTFDGNQSWQRRADDEYGEEESSSGDSDQHRKSLKQLISYGAKDDQEEEERKYYCSLGQHFTQEEKETEKEEEQEQQKQGEKEVEVHAGEAQLLQVVKKQQHPRQDGVRGMMSRYARVLSHLVRAKREPRIAPSRKGKTRLFRLTM